MTPAEKLWLETMYNQDSSFAYECSDDDLNRLLTLFGEMEPIIDAMNARSGVSLEQRASDIGCQVEDFDQYNDDEIIMVEDLIFESKIPWSYGR
jgi:hypothetical protein